MEQGLIGAAGTQMEGGTIALGGYAEAARPSRSRKVLKITLAAAALLLVAAGIGGYVYWRRLENTPQYSLALMVDAARRNDQKTIDQLVDTDAMVDDFLPQITGKAVELYGRGLPPSTISRVEKIAQPLIPAVKDRARAELPRMIRKKTEKFENVPFAAMVIGADRYLEIAKQDEKTAFVRSKLPEHSFEVEMRREGDLWKVVGVRDDQLATYIARAVGQEIIAVASDNGSDPSRNKLGVQNLGELLRQAEEIFR